MIWSNLDVPKDDSRWLQELLKDGERPIVHVLLSEYAWRWINAYADEPTPHRKTGVARREANTWIRREVEKLRHQEPETVKRYREIVKNGPPKCCHTCENYSTDGVCTVYDMRPPEDFAATDGACQDYIQEIPF